MQDSGSHPPDLSAGARRIVENVLSRRPRGAPAPDVCAWLLALIELHRPMLERQIERLDGLTLARNLEVEIGSGRSGPPLTPDEVIVQAWGLASARNSPKVFESDLIRALLQLTQADPKLQTLIDLEMEELAESFNSTLWRLMG